MSHTSTASWQVLVQRFLFKEMKVQVFVEKCHNVQKCWQEPKEKCWEVKLIMTGIEFYIVLLGASTKMSSRARGEVCPSSAREVLAGLKIYFRILPLIFCEQEPRRKCWQEPHEKCTQVICF